MNLRVFDSLADLAAAVAVEVSRRIDKDGARVIGLSGGSTPKSLYQLLGGGDYRDRLAKFAITWIVEDERYVPPDHPDSNSRMIEQSLFRSGLPQPHRFLRFRTELEDPRETAEMFEREWHEMKLTGLDLAILGVGEDGHTASLFPGTAILEVGDRVAAEVWVPRLNAWRVTMTLPYLQNARFKYVLANGASKRDVVERARRSEELPISRVAEQERESWWFVDREAYPQSQKAEGEGRK